MVLYNCQQLHALEIRAVFDGKKDDKWIYAANYTALKKAETERECRAGSIGFGSIKAESINVCIEESFAAVGIPLTYLIKSTLVYRYQIVVINIYEHTNSTKETYQDLYKRTSVF